MITLSLVVKVTGYVGTQSVGKTEVVVDSVNLNPQVLDLCKARKDILSMNDLLCNKDGAKRMLAISRKINAMVMLGVITDYHMVPVLLGVKLWDAEKISSLVAMGLLIEDSYFVVNSPE